MPVDQIRYDLLTMKALRGMVRDLLIDAAKNGLPGEHHFFIAFDTHASGVRISPRLLAQYPEEMTVVLQHQFWDMKVSDEAFEVGLSFGGVPERLRVPFESIRGFFDPSVEFGLQFQEKVDDTADAADKRPALPEAADKLPAPATSFEQDTIATLPVSKAAVNRARDKAENPVESDPDDDPDKPSGEVVRLDRFRKK